MPHGFSITVSFNESAALRTWIPLVFGKKASSVSLYSLLRFPAESWFSAQRHRPILPEVTFFEITRLPSPPVHDRGRVSLNPAFRAEDTK